MPFGGGGAVALRLQFQVATLNEMKAVDVKPTRGDFGLPDAVHHQAGRPAVRSTLYFRMAKVRPRPDAALRLRTPR